MLSRVIAKNVWDVFLRHSVYTKNTTSRCERIFLAGGGGLAVTYTVHIRLIGKLVVDILLIIELFSLSVAAEIR